MRPSTPEKVPGWNSSMSQVTNSSEAAAGQIEDTQHIAQFGERGGFPDILPAGRGYRPRIVGHGFGSGSGVDLVPCGPPAFPGCRDSRGLGAVDPAAIKPPPHACNTLVAGARGYRLGNYARLGLPLSVTVL